jgi:hypothetical protein
MLNYHRVTATGAVGLAISGFGTDQVVDPTLTDPYLIDEDASIADNQRFVDEAKRIAATINLASTTHQIRTAGGKIAALVEYFYENLFVRGHDKFLPPGTGTRVAGQRQYRLELAEDASQRDGGVRGSLNRSPQQVTITLNAPQRVVPAVHWAWERANVLRVEAPVDITADPPGLMGTAGMVSFTGPAFTLKIARIRPCAA